MFFSTQKIYIPILNHRTLIYIIFSHPIMPSLFSISVFHFNFTIHITCFLFPSALLKSWHYSGSYMHIRSRLSNSNATGIIKHCPGQLSKRNKQYSHANSPLHPDPPGEDWNGVQHLRDGQCQATHKTSGKKTKDHFCRKCNLS